jgi:hypothetical protein
MAAERKEYPNGRALENKKGQSTETRQLRVIESFAKAIFF